MTASHLAALVVLHTLATSLTAAVRCMTSESHPVDVYNAAARNAAAVISIELELIAEGML